MSTINRVELSGRLTRDPEIRYLGNTRFPVASFNVAVDDGSGRWNRETRKTEYGSGFYKVEAAGQYGEYLCGILTKGDEIHVVGSLSQFARQKQDGGETTTHTSIRAVVVTPLKTTNAMPRQEAFAGIAPPADPAVDPWATPDDPPF